MYKFKISNRKDALGLVDALKENSQPLGHPYFGYLIFLATELDQNAATTLLQSYNGLDSLTGSIVAGIVCIDKVKVPCEGQLVGIDTGYKNRNEAVTVRKLAELADKEECTHMDLEESPFATKYLTHSTDRVARILGVTNNLPCIAILDCNSPDEAEIVALPTAMEDLTSFVRELMAELAECDNYEKSEAILEELLELHKANVVLGNQLNALNEALEYLADVSGNPRKKLVSLLGSTNNDVGKALTPQRIKVLRSVGKAGELSKGLFCEISDCFNLISDSISMHSRFEDIKRAIAVSVIEEIAPGRYEKLQKEIYKLEECRQELQKNLLDQNIPSIREAARKISKRKKLQCFKHNVVSQSSTVAKELAKPSLWLKIAQYFS